VAKEKNGTAEVQKAPTVPTAISQAFAPEGWVTVVDSRLMYKPEECGKAPVQGIMLGTQEMNPSKENVSENNKAWTALVVKLTKPSKAVDGNDQVVDVPAGEEIFVHGYDLNSLYAAANHQLDAYEVLLIPDKILALGGGHKMWQFKKAVNPKAYNRKENGLSFFRRNLKKAETATEHAQEADIPF